MAVSICFKVAGPTYALSVALTQHAAVAVVDSVNEQSNAALFCNRGAVDVIVVLAPLPGSPGAPSTTAPVTPPVVFPLDGVPTAPNSFLLPAGMILPLAIATPSAGGFVVSAIGSAAGPSIVYVTPVALMS